MKYLDKQQKGQVLVLLALALVMLLGIIAIAIDIGRAYGVKAKLNAAVDAASYEAAKALAQGSGEEGMRQKAVQVARDYFSANYKLEFLGAPAPVPTVTALRNQNTGVWNVRVAASAPMPTFFAGMLGWRNIEVNAASEAVRGTIDMALVLDTSNSMASDMSMLKARAKDFVDHFDDLDDRVSVVAFATGAYPVLSICGDYPNSVQNPAEESMTCARGYNSDKVKAAIDSLVPGGMTASEEGLKKGFDQLMGVKADRRSGHRAIVFFSDGAPNTFNGRFPLVSGGTVDGNLYSGVLPGDGRPGEIFDPRRYLDAGETHPIADLPTHDLSGTIPTANTKGKRSFVGIKNDLYLKCDANTAARNMTENMAELARKEGIAVYSLAFGGEIDTRQMFDHNCSTYSENGVTVLRRLANTTDSDTYEPRQPSGIYCRARDSYELKACFDKVASAILRLTK